MGEVIGTSTYFATWCACRTPVGNNAPGLSGGGVHNFQYINGFKTSEGNGLFRFDPYARIAFGSAYLIYDDFSFVFLLEYATLSSVIDQKEADELIGETVTLTGSGSFAITSDYLTVGGQAVSSSGFNPIVSIGKLTTY
jgi:hypothetical protein